MNSSVVPILQTNDLHYLSYKISELTILSIKEVFPTIFIFQSMLENTSTIPITNEEISSQISKLHRHHSRQYFTMKFLHSKANCAIIQKCLKLNKTAHKTVCKDMHPVEFIFSAPETKVAPIMEQNALKQQLLHRVFPFLLQDDG